MVGRSAYEDPYSLASVDQDIFNKETLILSRTQILESLIPYLEKEIRNGNKLSYVTKHLMGLFKNTKYAKKARKILATIDHGKHPMEKVHLLINETRELC
ncbi:MAG TPA: hypothetical protein EYP94_05940 [Gammaproteobacteria bacterium]|nr:hypothetical protein [Gammaproteobacteria bacterium]